MNSFKMDINLREEGQIVTVEVGGSINAVHSPQLREAIANSYEKNILGVIVDLGQVTYIDSSGLATLVEGIQLAESHDLKFFLCGTLDEKIQHMLEITRLKELFEHYETQEDAKAGMVL